MAIFNKSANGSNNRQSSIIAAGAYIKGDLRLDSMIYIDGELEGTINSTDSVIIGKNGYVKGDVNAKRLVINGKLDGNIDADLVEILKDALFKGDTNVYDLICESGGRFMGRCSYRELKKDANNEIQNIQVEYLASPQE